MLRQLTSLVAVTLLASGCISANGEEGPDGIDLGGKADSAFSDDAFYLTGAFDGSQRFGMWADTMEFARRIERDHGKRLRWTYFINTCYYDRSVTGSWIGTAQSRDEEIVRWALTQQAANEGHEIANHSVRHQDGSDWSAQQWRDELSWFHRQVEANLFEPLITFNEGNPEAVFPRWAPIDGAEAGETGAACQTDSECGSGQCLPITPTQSFCSQGCNRHNPCPSGTVCGAPQWNESLDACVPMPEFPVEYDGEILFDAEGNPNLEHPALQPLRMVGFRAPQLGNNAAMFEVLTEMGYQYDTSLVIPVGPPQRVRRSGRTFDQIYEFGLMRNSGSATIPMDYNYKYGNYSGARMYSDYERSILDAYNERDRQPWNIGHHFALWQGGAYWQAMQDAFEFAARGCPDGAGNLRCEEVEFPTFQQLAGILDGINNSSDCFECGDDLWDLGEDSSEPEDGYSLPEDQDCHSDEC